MSNPDPVDQITGLTTAADVVKQDVRAEMKAVVRAFGNADAVRARNLTDRTRILIGDRLYRKDTASTLADDGTNVVIDGAGNHWLRIMTAEDGTGFTPRGTYSGAVTYEYLDLVVNQNSSWVYINATPGAGNAPPTLPTQTNAYWQLVAQQGTAGSATSSADVAWSGDISPSSIAADQNNYNPTGLSGAAVIRVSTSGPYAINGLAGGADGRIIVIKNVGTNPLIIGAERASSTAANRFTLTADLVIGPGEAEVFFYDATASRWTRMSANARPQHLDATPDPFPSVPHKPTVYADWSTMHWLDRHFTFTNATANRPILDRRGIVKYVGGGVPEFTSLYESGHSGYQSAEARTNLVTKSAAFDHANWLKAGLTVTADAVAGPDGLVVADKFIESNTNAEHYLQQTISGLNTANPYSQSIFVKQGDARRLRFAQYSNPTVTNSAHVFFDPATGAFSNASLSGAAGSHLYDKELLPDGWWRVFMRAVLGAGETSITFRYGLGNPTSVYLGDGASGLHVWGAQAESGLYPTPYIPTDTAQVTRANSTLFFLPPLGLMGTIEHTMVFDGLVRAFAQSGGSHILCELSNNTVNNRIGILVNSSGQISGYVFVDGSLILQQNVGSPISLGASFKVALTCRAGNLSMSLNGGTVATGTPASIPGGMTHFYVGGGAGGQRITGVAKRIAYLPRYLPSHVQALSA
jgi:hypothetical protein